MLVVQVLLSYCVLSENVKAKIRETPVFCVIVCGCETWSFA